MTNYTQEQLREKFNALPENIQESIISVDTAKIINDISNKYSLHVDQMGKLAEETGLVMLGATRPEEFLDGVKDGLNIPLETAGEIVKEVNEQIFFPIRESLKNVHHIAPATDPYAVSTAPKVEPITENKSLATTPGGPAGNPLNLDEKNENLFNSKFSKMFNLPKEETTTEQQKPIATPEPTSPIVKTKADPYREVV